jgi:hypothetical protein
VKVALVVVLLLGIAWAACAGQRERPDAPGPSGGPSTTRHGFLTGLGP